MKLQPVQRIEGLTKQEFTERFVKTKTPVILKDFVKGPALDLWNYDYFKEVAGDLMVPVHGSENAHPDMVKSAPIAKMKFGEYLDLIQSQPTESRLFLFNLLIEKPEIRKQLIFNKIADNILTWLPLMFFGGGGSSTRNHFDIDMSHVFLTQFHGEKKVTLFPNKASSLLYKLPYNFHGIGDMRNMDFEKFPALQYADGWEGTIRFGETLFMPAGYWHYIQYLTGGYSVSVRALSSAKDRVTGFSNLVFTRNFDNAMRKILKDKWYNYKVKEAHSRAEKAIQKLERKGSI
ncbi:MAG: cupin-like domain-containing protein [Agriterribacter sp.]